MGERIWLITGCSAGFGREIALAALRDGDRVMATARRPEQLAGLVDEWGDRVRTHALDVTSGALLFARKPSNSGPVSRSR